jgi:outer membrane lipase/esterase
VPDIGHVPAVHSLGAAATFLGSAVSSAMNDALMGVLATEPDVSLFDIFGLQNELIGDPAAFGLVNVTDACGAVPACDPSTYLYWDGIHPTSGGHALIADAMVTVAVPEPAEYALLVVGFAAIAGRLRARRAAASRS